MKVAMFSAQQYDKDTFLEKNKSTNHELVFNTELLDENSASLAEGYDAVCAFVNDHLDAPTISKLAEHNVKLIALRCAGYNNVDLDAAGKNQITVVRVPCYSPFAIAEYTVGLLLAVNRKIHRAWLKVRMDNFCLDGLVGQDLHGKVVGILGTGEIGSLVARALHTGFGCQVIVTDVRKNIELEKIGITYVEFNELLSNADVVCLHCPLNETTRHIINMDSIKLFKKGATLINTSRGGLTCTKALIEAIEKGYLGALAMDVYEDEKDLFFRDLSSYVLKDVTFRRLTAFPNVICTGHQAFLTSEALDSIATTTLTNISNFEAGQLDSRCKV